MSQRLQKLLLLSGICAVLSGGLVSWARWSQPGRPPGADDVPAPALFAPAFACPRVDASPTAGFRLERAARLRAERYPYDPEDGVRAVELFLQARSCYRASGSEANASRAERLAHGLRRRVETDYASARLVLRQALRRDHFSSANRETRRLLAMTRHLRPDPYFHWLQETAGRLSAHADVLP